MWLYNYGQLMLSTCGSSRTNQKELGGLAEVRRETYLHNLAKLAIAGLVLGLAFLLLWSFVTAPRFDEGYVRSLLARHDPIIAHAMLDGMATEEPDGLSTFTKSALESFLDPNNMTSAKELEVVADDNGSVLLGSLTTFASVPESVIAAKGVTRNWRCPGGTEFNLSVEETPQYLYIGTTNTYLPYLEIQTMINDAGGLSSNVSPSWNESWNPDMDQAFRFAAQWMHLSEVHYYNPSERGEFDAKMAEIADITSACEEIV